MSAYSACARVLNDKQLVRHRLCRFVLHKLSCGVCSLAVCAVDIFPVARKKVFCSVSLCSFLHILPSFFKTAAFFNCVKKKTFCSFYVCAFRKSRNCERSE